MSAPLEKIKKALFSRHLFRLLPEEAGPETILLTDADPIFLQLIAKRFPCAVLSQADSDQTRETLIREKKRFDLIIAFGEIKKNNTQLADLISLDGYILITFNKTDTEIPNELDKTFSRWNCSSFFDTDCCLYRPFGRGRVGDRLPDGYKDRQESRTILSTILTGFPPKEFVGTPGPLGVRTKLGPFFVDEFTSDTEPDVSASSRLRMITWQPLTISKKAGWLPFGFLTDSFQKGIGIITDKNTETYFQEWSKHARRHRDRWLRDGRYEMVLVSLDEYAKAYHASKKLEWLTRTGFVHVLKYHVERHPEDVRCRSCGDSLSGYSAIFSYDIFYL